MFAHLSSSTSAAIINVLKSWFNILGWPQSVRSDGGPQFRGEFSRFCDQFGIKHELSAPYNPRSNGLAESGVEIIKSILVKCLGEGKDMHRTLYEWRNVPRQHGYSPAPLMFGRSQNTLLPQPPKAFSPIDLQQAARDKDKAFQDQAAAYDKDKCVLSKLPGEKVREDWLLGENWRDCRDASRQAFLLGGCRREAIRPGQAYVETCQKRGSICEVQVQVQGGVQAEAEVKESPRRSEGKEFGSIKVLKMCPPNDDAAKLREYRRLDRLHREQIDANRK